MNLYIYGITTISIILAILIGKYTSISIYKGGTDAPASKIYEVIFRSNYSDTFLHSNF